MRVMSQSPDPLARMHTMTKRQGKTGTIDVKAVLAEDEEFLRALVRTALQEVLEAEMTEALGAGKGERVREAGVIVSQAVLIAIGIDWDGRRQVLAVELSNRESRSSWRDFLLRLKARGLHGVEFVVADDHAGLRAALREALAEAAYQRCYVHFLRNALDYVPRRVDDDCLQELRWLYDRRDLPEARRDLAVWLAKWSGKYRKLTDWVEENIEETLTFYRLPRQHHKHLESTNMLARLNHEIKRRTHVVRIFPNGESCLRLVRALAVETHENSPQQHPQIHKEALRPPTKATP